MLAGSRSGSRRRACIRGCAVFGICAAVGLTPGAASSFAVSAPSFAARKSYPTGKIPVSVAVGDLNGDGKPDVAVANEGAESESVSVLLNRGDGRLRPRRDYATGLEPNSVAIGDLNGDGKLDLATANEDDGTVSVLLNRGDGSFRARRDYPAGFVVSVAIGDLNGDGKPDLAGADWSSGGVSVFINKGDGSFQPKRRYTTGTETESVAIGDLNDDGYPDLAAANRYAGRPTVSVLLNRGDGSFGAKHDYTGADPVWVTIGDLNGDDRPELAVANFELDSVSVFENNGDGSFRKRRDYAAGNGARSVVIGDLNGDGRPELATTDLEANTVSVLVNTGGGLDPRLSYRTGVGPVQLAIGDLSGDGRSDIVTADYRGPGTTSVLLNSPKLCVVQRVRGATLSAARQTLARAHCRVGKIRRAPSKRIRAGRIVSQSPSPYTVLREGGKVNLVVSRGHRH